MRDRIVQIKTLISFLYSKATDRKYKYTLYPRKHWWNLGMPINVIVGHRQASSEFCGECGADKPPKK